MIIPSLSELPIDAVMSMFDRRDARRATYILVLQPGRRVRWALDPLDPKGIEQPSRSANREQCFVLLESAHGGNAPDFKTASSWSLGTRTEFKSLTGNAALLAEPIHRRSRQPQNL
jgi:hypothetical protein